MILDIVFPLPVSNRSHVQRWCKLLCKIFDWDILCNKCNKPHL